MKNKQKGFIVPLFITLLALLTVAGGVYYYKQAGFSSDSFSTYTNNFGGISIMYPSHLKQTKVVPASGGSYTQNTQGVLFNDLSSPRDSIESLSVTIQNNSNYTTLDLLGSQNLSYQNLIIDGISAKEAVTKNSLGSNIYYLYLIKAPYVYTVTYTSDQHSDGKVISDKIFQSIKISS